MISPVSSNPGVNLTALQSPKPAGPEQKAKPAAENPTDTVKLSAKALAHAGEADHDGH